VIVVSSLTLELALHGVAQEVAALLVFFRLWRIVRIMHGLADVLEIHHEEHLAEHHRELERLNEVRPAAALPAPPGISSMLPLHFWSAVPLSCTTALSSSTSNQPTSCYSQVKGNA
jgi:hypothetical protein